MKYKFRKIKMKGENSKGTWYFIPQNVEQVLEHWQKFCHTEISEGMDEVTQNLLRRAKGELEQHYTTSYGSIICLVSEARGEHPCVTAYRLENEIFERRLKDIENEEIYLSDGLTRFAFVDAIHELMEEVEMDKLEFPKDKPTSIDDFRFIKWSGGDHWYVKLGNMDIVDEFGNQKWNSRSEAEEIARKYMEGKI